MSVALNDVRIWRGLLESIPDLYDDGALLQVNIRFQASSFCLFLFSFFFFFLDSPSLLFPPRIQFIPSVCVRNCAISRSFFFCCLFLFSFPFFSPGKENIPLGAQVITFFCGECVGSGPVRAVRGHRRQVRRPPLHRTSAGGKKKTIPRGPRKEFKLATATDVKMVSCRFNLVNPFNFRRPKLESRT